MRKFTVDLGLTGWQDWLAGELLIFVPYPNTGVTGECIQRPNIKSSGLQWQELYQLSHTPSPTAASLSHHPSSEWPDSIQGLPLSW